MYGSYDDGNESSGSLKFGMYSSSRATEDF